MLSRMVVEELKRRLISSFDIEEKETIEGKYFEFIGRYNENTTRYFGSKKVTFESFDASEILFCNQYNVIGIEDILEIEDYIKKKYREIAPPKKDHMSTCLTFVLIGKIEEEDVIKKVKKFKFYKEYLFGIKGWINTKLICVDPMSDTIVACKRGRKGLKFIENILSSIK